MTTHSYDNKYGFFWEHSMCGISPGGSSFIGCEYATGKFTGWEFSWWQFEKVGILQLEIHPMIIDQRLFTRGILLGAIFRTLCLEE